MSPSQQVLQQVPEADRNRVALLANYIGNTDGGGRPSDNARRAVRIYLDGGLEASEAERSRELNLQHRRECMSGPAYCTRCREVDAMR